MAKPLVFVKNKVRIEKINKEVDSWDLIAFGDCPIMHAAWNPSDKLLVCQFDSHKENLLTVPKQNPKSGKMTFGSSRADQYYRVTLYDLDAVKFILDTYVANEVPEDWMLQDQLEDLEENQVVEKQEGF